MTRYTFTVDAALLRELGERLVGQPHVALAELVKNSYDADASRVSIEFGTDQITVVDDGDGMTVDDFRNFWMRIGSPHKQGRIRTALNRVPTGSKGIGRLAVQFLGAHLRIRTTPLGASDRELIVRVNWTETSSTELSGVDVEGVEGPRRDTYAGGSDHGTEIVVERLNQEWDQRALEGLAQQIWQLQTPFRSEGMPYFRIELKHPQKTVARNFESGMRRNLDIWSARLRGRLLPTKASGALPTSRIRLLLEFAGEEPIRHDYTIENCNLHHVDFEIRIFSLYNKQRHGIGVEQAREYLREHGGVHVYDGNFHLPYYGADTDWLKIEIDHSHRIGRSKLLPPELQIVHGLNNLPTLSRVFGVVNVDTTREWIAARSERRLRHNEYLQIQASRDRLVDNPSYRSLRDIVRYAIDFYAVEQTRRTSSRMSTSTKAGGVVGLGRISDILESFRDAIPKRAFSALSREIRRTSILHEAEAKRLAEEMKRLRSAAQSVSPQRPSSVPPATT